MSGILDSKSRVLDTVITTEGRRQLALGGVDIQYVSFTDASAFYRADIASGSQDATSRLYLESCQLPQDDIVFLADDDGNIMPFRNSDGVQVAGGRILQYSFTATTGSVIEGSTQRVIAISGSTFASVADTLLASSLDNFRKMYLIASKDQIFEDDTFGIGPDNIEFVITNDRPINDPASYSAHVNSIDSIFSDPRCSHLANFKYLPPINKVTSQNIDKSDPRATRDKAFGYYTPWGRTHVHALTYDQIMLELDYYAQLGYSRTVNFDPTSRDNRLVGQFFEKTKNELKKLDVIEFGTFTTNKPSAPISQIFFVGKVVVDDKGTDTFLHLFTLVFE